MGLVWPVWLPYPRSWLRAGGNLFCWVVLTEGMLEGVFKNRDYALSHCWIDDFGRVNCTSDDNRGELLLFGFFVNLIIQVVLVAIAHHWIAKLRGKSRGWFPRWPSWREGLNGSIAIFFSFIFVAIAGILFVAIFPRWLTIRTLVPAILGGMLAMNAYLHQYEYRVRERRAARMVAKRSQTTKKKGGKRTTSPSPLPTTPPVDPVEQELNQMRADLGLNQMRRRQKPPENSQ